MRNPLLLVALLATLLCLAGCLPSPLPSSDPFGVTNRARLRADADTAKAQAERDARIGVAQAQADGIARAAEAKGYAERQTAQAWAGMIPFALLVIGATIVFAIVVNWQGRIHLERTRQRASLPPPMARRIAIPAAVQLEARRLGGVAHHDGELWTIVQSDTRRVIARERKQLS